MLDGALGGLGVQSESRSESQAGALGALGEAELLNETDRNRSDGDASPESRTHFLGSASRSNSSVRDGSSTLASGSSPST